MWRLRQSSTTLELQCLQVLYLPRVLHPRVEFEEQLDSEDKPHQEPWCPAKAHAKVNIVYQTNAPAILVARPPPTSNRKIIMQCTDLAKFLLKDLYVYVWIGLPEDRAEVCDQEKSSFTNVWF